MLKMKKDKFNKEQLKQISLVCFRSATELLEDAELLFSMHRYARATFLSFIGLEELGKSILAFNLIKYKVEPKRSEFLDFWRDHILKLAHAYGYCGINPEALQKILPDEVPKGHKD